jgi:hypothetical protein
MTIAAMETGRDGQGGALPDGCQAAGTQALDALFLELWRTALAELARAAPASADTHRAAGVLAEIMDMVAAMTIDEAARDFPATLRAIADDAAKHPALAGVRAPTLGRIAAAMAARAAT